MIDGTGVFLLHQIRQLVLIDIPCWECAFEPRLGVFVPVIVVIQVISLLDLVVLVVAGPNHERWASPQSPYIIPSFLFDLLEKGWICRVARTGEGEILPDEDSKLVAGVVEVVFFVDSTSPYSEPCEYGNLGVSRDRIAGLAE